MYACLLIQLGRGKEATIILTSLASQGYETSKANLLLSISADLEGEPALAQKFKAMALLDHMRSKGSIPANGQTKQRAPGSHPLVRKTEEEPVEGEEVETRKNSNVEAAPAFKNVRLTQAEVNEVYLELANFLLDKSFYSLSKQCLQYVTEKDSVRVIFANTKSKMLLLQYAEAAEDLHHLFNNVDPDLTEAMILYGHCKFILGEYDLALPAYYKAMRVSNLNQVELKDSLVHQRIGAILIQKKMWNDAKVIFEIALAIMKLPSHS